MNIIVELVKFIVDIAKIEFPIGSYKFSLVGAICFCGAIAILMRVVFWLFEGD